MESKRKIWSLRLDSIDSYSLGGFVNPIMKPTIKMVIRGNHIGENTTIQDISIYHSSFTITKTKNVKRSSIPNPSPTLSLFSFIMIYGLTY